MFFNLDKKKAESQFICLCKITKLFQIPHRLTANWYQNVWVCEKLIKSQNKAYIRLAHLFIHSLSVRNGFQLLRKRGRVMKTYPTMIIQSLLRIRMISWRISSLMLEYTPTLWNCTKRIWSGCVINWRSRYLFSTQCSMIKWRERGGGTLLWGYRLIYSSFSWPLSIQHRFIPLSKIWIPM